MIDYPMCRGCRRANIDVRMARDAGGPCPFCGTPTWVEPAECCLPDCKTLVPDGSELPVCTPCGIKVALRHLHDAVRLDAVRAEARRAADDQRTRVRSGRVPTAVVYYVRLDEQRIKIGFTTKLEERLKALRIAPGGLLAVEPGGRDVESQRHHQFRGDRIDSRREDFRATERLLAWIADVATIHPQPAFKPDVKAVTVRKKAS